MNAPLLLPINVDDVLHGKTVEWERLEFKKGWNPQDVLHTLCAFANDFHNLGGGYIFIGIAEDRGQPVLPPLGLSATQLDSIQKEILNLGFNAIQPHYHPVVVPYVIGGKQILVIWAPAGQNRPYKATASLAKDKAEWGYFIRKASSTVRARGQDEADLLALANQIPFDDRINRTASLDDLRRPLIEAFLKEIGSDFYRQSKRLSHAQVCRQMNIAGGPNEMLRPLNVGLMFFNEYPEKFFPATQIDVVIFPEGPGGNVFTEKVFKGPVHRGLREALDYLQRQVIEEIVIKHPDRPEAERVFNVPMAALEEALVNAVYHRSYDIREPVEVRIVPNEITISSQSGPDRSISLEALNQGNFIARRNRNRRIGEFLKELSLTEGRGTGVPKMIKAMKTNGSPRPRFETDPDRTYFVVRLPVHPKAIKEAERRKKEEALIPQVTPQVTPQVERLLTLCKTPLTRAELQTQLGILDRKHFRRSYLSPALNAGLIEWTVPDKPNSRFQRYRLTVKGQTWLERALKSS